MEDLSNAGAEALALEPVSDAPAQEPVTDAAPADKGPEPDSEDALNAELSKIFKNAKREPAERAPDGKFTSKNPAPSETAEAPKEVDQPQEQTAPEAQKVAPIGEAPVSWSAEMKAKFGTLPPEVQNYVLQRDKETHEHISKLGNAVASFRPIGETLKQYEDTFKSKGIGYADGISQLLRAQRALDTNPVAAIAELANAYGVDLGRLAGGPENPQQSALLSEVNTLKSELATLRQSVSQREAAERAQRSASLEDAVTKFSADKPDFEELADDIATLVSAMVRQNPKASHGEILKEAYDKARWANPKTRAKLVEEQTKAAEQKRIEEAKKNAAAAKAASAVNVKGQAKANADTDNLDEILAATYRRATAA